MSGARSPFKRVRVRGTPELDIESLFKDLKNRDPEIRDLFAHQADILREYNKSYVEASDVSLELPTGSGKTLVGLLIAEWRRRIRNERVLYLCPTKQLAYQVYRHSKKYGIESRVFVGPKRNYNRTDLILYRSAKVIAVSTYSGLFNTSPGIDDPQTIILDDAHGAETYICSMWSLDIDRSDEPELYLKIVEIFEKDLPPDFINSIQQPNRPRAIKTEKVPFGAFHRSLSVLRDTLNSNIEENKAHYFSWITIREGLQACHVYISYDGVLIRPYIPPTMMHKPFANANQRVYMSATLGRGGELERITGIKEIKRIATPRTYLSRGIGRRLYLFPDFSKDPGEYNDWITYRLGSVDRTLVLAPNKFKAQDLKEIADKCTSPRLSVLGAAHIEENMEPFTGSYHSILLLTNRYDGIDLPHGVCKQVVIAGLPSGTNLQEEFLELRLGLDVLLRERVKTRIEQASGRCTRSDTDRAAIIMLDRRLLDFCARVENQKLFHPEIRAEIIFALDQAKTISDLEPMLKSFMDKDRYWETAEENIAEVRSLEELPDRSVTDILASVVKDEVDLAYSMWMQDYKAAVEHGEKVADGLSGIKVAPYRALWYYFVATAAHAQAKTDKAYEKLKVDYLDRAKKACRTVSWFSYAMRTMRPERGLIEDTSELQALAIEGIIDLLSELGSTGPRFQRRMNEVTLRLKSKDAKSFDLGLVDLGRMLGFSSSKPEGEATPDCIWKLGNHILFVFEGKSEESPEGGVSVQDCRQASGHLDWAAAENGLKDIKVKISILVSPKSKIDANAVPHAKDVYFFSISDVNKLFEKAKSVLIESRGTMTTGTTNELGDRVLQTLIRMNLTPEEVQQLLTSKSVTALPLSGVDN